MKKSKSAEAARRANLERLKAMTPRQRVLLALSLKHRTAALARRKA